MNSLTEENGPRKKIEVIKTKKVVKSQNPYIDHK